MIKSCKEARLTWPAIDRIAGLQYWSLFYAIIPELFIRMSPHWWTDAIPYQQLIRYTYRTTPLISLSFALILLLYPSHVLCQQSDTTSLRDMNIKSLFWTRLSTRAIFAYWHPKLSTWQNFLATYVLLKHGLGWVWLSFMAQDVF